MGHGGEIRIRGYRAPRPHHPRIFFCSCGKISDATPPFGTIRAISNDWRRVIARTALAVMRATDHVPPATFLIVLALAGAPAVSLTCDLWCASASAREHHRIVGCHDASRGAATQGDRIAGTSADCHDALSSALFVTEVRSEIPSPPPGVVPSTLVSRRSEIICVMQ
jgi:hypothetical protein